MLDSQSRGVWIDEVAARRPMPDLWYQFATITLTFVFVDNFAAYELLFPLTPTKYLLLLMPMLTATLIVCPKGVLSRVYLPLTGLLFVGWWMLSYLWDGNRGVWLASSARDFATIVTIVVLGQLLGKDAFVRCLLRSGYIAIGLIFFALAVQPELAYQVAGTAPGLRGAFIHKNAMAPALLLTALVVVCTHPSRAFRRWFVVFIAILLLFGQTTTGLATLAVLVFLNWMLASYKRVVERLGRSAGSLLVGGAMVVTLVAATTFSSLVMLSGKDLTFSSRTVIWEGVSDAISRQFWIGYGYAAWGDLWSEPVRTINLQNGFVVAHAHNAVLDLMLRLGVVGLGLYLLQFFNTVRTGWGRLLRDDSFGRLMLLFCAMLVPVGFSESSPGFGLWPGLLIAFTAIARMESKATIGAAP